MRLSHLRRVINDDLAAMLLSQARNLPAARDHGGSRCLQRYRRLQRIADHRSAAKTGQQFVGAEALALSRRQQNNAELHHASCSPSRIFSAVIGRSRTRTPLALYTAFAMAGAGVLMTHSPMDFAPNGPVGS